MPKSTDVEPPVPGEVEIVFSGLCSFLNLRNMNGTMPEPSVILPRTPNEAPHVPYIAYDKREVELSQQTGGGAPFVYVETTDNDFYYRALDGVEVAIEDDPVGWPVVLPSYDLVSKKDDYWPYAKNQWDRRFVPSGSKRPDDRFVAAFMYLGGGSISGERMTDFPWEFRDDDGSPTVRGYYAQEVVYRIYPFFSDELTIVVTRLDGQPPDEVFTFKCKRPSVRKIKLWIGNNDKTDIHRSLLRLSSQPRQAVHFEYLNDVASVSAVGPLPVPLVPRGTFPTPSPTGGGGSDTGYCGPSNPDGG